MTKTNEKLWGISFTINESRKKKGVKRQQLPIKRSEYAVQLFKIGAGFNDGESK